MLLSNYKVKLFLKPDQEENILMFKRTCDDIGLKYKHCHSYSHPAIFKVYYPTGNQVEKLRQKKFVGKCEVMPIVSYGS